MTIADKERYMVNLWDWGCLDGCFGDTRIKPTDIDGFVERNGRFLVIETKEPTASIPKGQEITLQALARTGLFTIMIVWGHPGKPERIRLFSARGERYFGDANLDKLRDLVKGWFRYANTCPIPQPKQRAQHPLTRRQDLPKEG